MATKDSTQPPTSSPDKASAAAKPTSPPRQENTSGQTGNARRTPAQVAGVQAEALAAEHLTRHGMRLLARNFRVKGGEIDLVAEDGRTLVFVEVRLRRNARFGSAGDSITANKRRRVILAAQVFLARHSAYRDRPCRFDCILLDALNGNAVEWIRDAFHTA